MLKYYIIKIKIIIIKKYCIENSAIENEKSTKLHYSSQQQQRQKKMQKVKRIMCVHALEVQNNIFRRIDIFVVEIKIKIITIQTII